MSKAPRWTEDEFRTLLENEHLSVEALSKLINRTPDAIVIVRAGVEYWRKGDSHHGMLSKMMISVLSQEDKGRVRA